MPDGGVPSWVIFVSAVSREFASVPPEQRHRFQSYRDVLKETFRILAPKYEVIVQEDLVLGFGDLLETLDHEIHRSLFVVHLVGDIAGDAPVVPAVQRLLNRHPSLCALLAIDEQPMVGPPISYTQWELYLALHYEKKRLIFKAKPTTPRSPSFESTDDDRLSQLDHHKRIKAAGAHYAPFEDQGDLTRKTIRAFLHMRIDPSIDPVEPDADSLANAREHADQIVQEVFAAGKNPNPRDVPVIDTANAAPFIAAVRATASRWHVNMKEIVNILASERGETSTRNLVDPTPQSLYEEAQELFAEADYTQSAAIARRSADLSRQLRRQNPTDGLLHREAFINALLLLHDAYLAMRDISRAVDAYKEALSFVDRAAEPVYWADLAEPLADFHLQRASYQDAEALIDDVIDIREECQPNSEALLHSLLLWGRLLSAVERFDGLEGVYCRAEEIAVTLSLPEKLHLLGSVLNDRAQLLRATNRLTEAEPLQRRALEIFVSLPRVAGLDHPDLEAVIRNYGLLLIVMGRTVDEAAASVRDLCREL